MEIAVLAIGAVLPLVLQDYLTIYATRVLILCLFALSFDLVWGYAGIMSFGQAVFFGSAGYGVALIARALPTAADDPECPLDAILARAAGMAEAEPVSVITGVLDILRTGDGPAAARKWASSCVLSGECNGETIEGELAGGIGSAVFLADLAPDRRHVDEDRGDGRQRRSGVTRFRRCCGRRERPAG